MDSSTHAEPIHEPPSDESIRAGHEVRDVNFRVLLGLIAAVGAMIVVVSGVLYLFDSGMESSATRHDPELSPLANMQSQTAAPRLQDTPVRDYQAFLHEQQAALDSYGWIDRKQGIVRLPIARAKQLILEKGLLEPKAQDNPSSANDKTDAPPNGSNSEEQP